MSSQAEDVVSVAIGRARREWGGWALRLVVAGKEMRGRAVDHGPGWVLLDPAGQPNPVYLATGSVSEVEVIGYAERAGAAPEPAAGSWPLQLWGEGYDLQRVGYLVLARALVDSGLAKNPGDLHCELGAGLVPLETLMATFWPD